tara:strand:+ start:991 stop:2214 length:1224 start_codon:yes stop_codon:yes gene_type:complete
MAIGKIKELFTDTVGAKAFASGPLQSLESDPFASTQGVFPLDVTGLGQRHFIRFNIVDTKGARFSDPEAEKNSEQADESVTGELVGGVFGGLAGGGLAGGAAAAVATNILDQSGIGGAIDDAFGEAGDLFNDALGGITSSLNELRNATVEKVPIAEDALNGVGSFLGSIGGQAESFVDTVLRRTESVGDVLLYMPPGVSETYQVSWEGSDLGTTGGAAKQFLTGGTDKVKQIINETDTSGLAGDLLSEAIGGAAGGVLGNEAIADLVRKDRGLGLNPNFELFFRGVQPRTFSFDFKLAPKNAEEAREIAKIVRIFKMNSAPGTLPGAEGIRYWTYPRLFEIEYWNSVVTHKIKPCGLTQIAVNYGGDGTNHTHYDGYPLQTDLTLTFTESQLLTRENFSEDSVVGGY